MQKGVHCKTGECLVYSLSKCNPSSALSLRTKILQEQTNKNKTKGKLMRVILVSSLLLEPLWSQLYSFGSFLRLPQLGLFALAFLLNGTPVILKVNLAMHNEEVHLHLYPSGSLAGPSRPYQPQKGATLLECCLKSQAAAVNQLQIILPISSFVLM